MLKKAVPNLKRWVSGYLVAVMTLMLVFNNSFALSALAAETASGSNAGKEASASDAFKNSKVTLKNEKKEDVQLLIFSEQASYEPGETVCLDLYIKNNTDKAITDGLLKVGKVKGVEEDSMYFEDMTDVYEAAHPEDEKPEETEEGTSAEDTEEKEEATTENNETESKEEVNIEDSESAETVENLIPTEDVAAAAEESVQETSGTDVAETVIETVNVEDKESTVTIEETEEKVEEGSVAVEDSEETTIDNKKTITEIEEEDIDEGKTEETDEEDKEEEEDPERLTELEILPGKTAYINFYYTIDPEIEGMKDQKVDFSFNYVLEDEDGKQSKNTLRESFRYAVDALNLMTVTAGGEKGFVETGKEDEMLLEFDLGQMREMLEEAVEEEIDKMENADASAAEAKRASASDILIKWDDESSDGAGSKKDPAVIKNLKCEVETFGLKLEKFKAVPVKDDDNFGTSLKCNFYVSRKTLPGTYYGRVNASYKIKGKSFHTVQGFQVVVKQETGELELVGKIGDSEIVMTGPVSSFPKADELSLKVSEVTQEQQEKVDEALQKKAEEEGSEIKQYKALDIKLMADGVETEPEGDVQVRFKNVELENADEKKEAEQEKAEEQSIVKKAVRKVMSLFGAKDDEKNVSTVAEVDEAEDATAEGSEKAAGTDGDKKEDEGKEESAGSEGAAENGENIKVLHLDEDAVVANEMKSEVEENGDVVMDTDHFSIYVVVDMGKPGGYINVTVEHWASVKTITAVDNNGNDMNLQDVGKGTESSRIVNDTTTFNEVKINGIKYAVPTSTGEVVIDGKKYTITTDTKEITIDNKKYPVKFLGKNLPFAQYMYDQVYNRYTQTINTKSYPLGKIYEPSNDIVIQNEKQIDKIESLSKLSAKVDGTIKNAQEKGYKIIEIWITNDKANLDQKIWKDGTFTKYSVNTWDGDKNVNEISGGQVDTILTEDGQKAAITLKEDSIIRFIYEELESEITYFPVTFYDHNLLDYGYKGVDLSTCGYNKVTHSAGSHTVNEGEGLNRPSFFKYQDNTMAKIGVGQKASGNTTTWTENTWNTFKLNAGNKKPFNGSTRTLAHSIPGIVQEKLDKGNLQFAKGINYPSFFQESTYTDENGETYFANKEIKDYKLGFKKEGDTYYLTSVKKPAGKTDLQNLDKIRYSQWSEWSSTALFSNEFWPLDEVDPYRGMDHYEGSGSDDGKIHNWHFGMVFEFDFTVDDYKGPMNFYFRGDDDFWMFIDGVKAIDIGGIHSAGGEAIDIEKFLNEQEEKGNKKVEGTHHVKIYFMERGGTGSCCYLQFTLPNCETVSFPGVDTTNIAVEKKWEEPADSLRTDKITVQLYRKKYKKGDEKKEPIIDSSKPEGYYDNEGFALVDDEDVEPVQNLGGFGNVWQYTWRSLPKVDPNEPHDPYIYKVKEKEVQGYISTYEYTSNGEIIPEDNVGSTDDVTCIITNKLSPKLTVEVEKKWKDQYAENENSNRPNVLLQLQYKKEGDDKFIDFPGEKGVLTLDGTPESNVDEKGNEIKSSWEYEAWHGRFKNLPSYADKTDENGNVVKDENDIPIRVPIIAYRVREYRQDTDENGKIIYTLLEDDNSKFSGDYTVTYEDNQYELTENVEEDTEDEESKDTEESPENKNLIATTTITNTATTDRYVMKNWEGIPSSITIPPTAQIGLWINDGTKESPEWRLVEDYVKLFNDETTADKITITDENNYIIRTEPIEKEGENIKEGVSENKQPFILELTYNSDPNKSCTGGWKNLPKYRYKDNKWEEIEYHIFEISQDESGNYIPIEPQKGTAITVIDNHKYEVIEGIYNSSGEVTNGTGHSNNKDDVFIITNAYMVDLNISKVITNHSPTQSFTFTITIEKDGQTFKLPIPDTSAGYQVNPDSGEITIELKANGEAVNIPVPIRSTVTIQENETSHAGYHVKYAINSQDPIEGDKIDISIPTDGTSPIINVVCTNTPGAILPDTGGPGLLMMSRLGWMLLLLALLMAGMEIQFYGERRNRKAATAQREDTRRFDPEDY